MAYLHDRVTTLSSVMNHFLKTLNWNTVFQWLQPLAHHDLPLSDSLISHMQYKSHVKPDYYAIDRYYRLRATHKTLKETHEMMTLFIHSQNN